MKVWSCRRCWLLAIALALALHAGEAPAQGSSALPGPRVGAEKLDGIAAVVGETPILSSEIEEQFAVLVPQFQIDPADSSKANQLRREILDNLISEQLLLMEAERQGLKVDSEQVDRTVSEAIEADRERLGAEGFAAELLREGITEADLRARYTEEARKEMLRRQLLQREVVAKVTVTDAQVQQRFQEQREKIGQKPRALRVLDLFLRTKPDSVVEANYRKRIEEIRLEVAAGMKFEDAAARYSDDEHSSDRGGLLGRFGPGDLGDRSFEQVAFTLPPGQLSDVVRTNLGYHIVQVVDRDPEGRWTQIRHILLEVPTSRSDARRTRERMEAIRESIVSKKTDFAQAVRTFSEDPASKASGGDVGWLPIDNFLGETRKAVDSLRVGQVSQVAEVEGGFHLFKLIGEQAESDYAFDEIRDQLRAVVEGELRQKRLDGYLAELRKKFYVEIRPM